MRSRGFKLPKERQSLHLPHLCHHLPLQLTMVLDHRLHQYLLQQPNLLALLIQLFLDLVQFRSRVSHKTIVKETTVSENKCL